MPTRSPRNPFLPKAPLKGFQSPIGDRDAAISGPPLSPAVMPPTIANFEGISNVSNGALFGFTVSPPDTVGDVGRGHYVQAVNLAMQVFRLDGVPLTGVFKMSDLFINLGVGNACANGDDDGDPIILYDSLADRWFVSQFATEGPPFHQCIAISQTGDPTGAYYVYDFEMPRDKFNDYPHMGVWPDGYYMTDNQFNAALTAFAGGGVFAFDRKKMLAGDPTASYIYFDTADIDPSLGLGGMLPSDADGAPPPVGAKNLFSMFTATEFGEAADGIRLWEFTANWSNPGASTFVELTSAAAPLAVAAFDPITPTGRSDIRQPGTGNGLDSIGDRLMHRMQYRNFGTHQSVAVNHSVDVSGDTTAPVYRAGVRWYELRNTGAGWFVHDQGTHDSEPGGTLSSWMGSAAMDRQGNLAVGFSTSGSDAGEFPSVAYAGRLATDPLGSLAQGQAVIVAGGRSQTSTGFRWGDYSSLTVDPVDDCTFWFTSEYYAGPTVPAGCGTATQCWQTRIGSFRFPSCPAAPIAGRVQGSVTNAATGAPVAGASVEIGNGYIATTNGSGVYSVSVPAATYDGLASKTGYTNDTETSIAVTSGGITTRNFALTGVPILTADNQVANDAVAGGNGNNLIEFDECPAITLTANNVGAAIANNTQGVLSTTTPGVTVTSPNAAFGNVFPGFGANNATPFVIQTSPTFVPGSPIDLSLALTSTEGSWNQAFSLATGIGNAFGFPTTSTYSIPDNLPAGTNVPVVVSGLTAPVSGVQLALRITHTWVGDLVATLSGPGGTPVVNLFTSPGASGANNSSDNLGADCPAGSNDLILASTGATSIQTIPSGNNGAGTFQPQASFAPFDGISGNGTWTLNIKDIAAQDVGTVECLALKIGNFVYTSGNCSAPLPDAMFSNGFEDSTR